MSLIICTQNNDMGGACSTYGGRGEMHTVFWWGDLFKGPSVCKRVEVRGNVLYGFGFGYGQATGSCECDNEPSGFIKCMKGFD
jgi:hypothetical protein